MSARLRAWRRAVCAVAAVCAVVLACAMVLRAGRSSGSAASGDKASAAAPAGDLAAVDEALGFLDMGDGGTVAIGERGDLLSAWEALGGAESTRYLSGRTLEEEAEQVLGSYEGRGDCVLAYAGSLDLLGGSWGCVVMGEGWVELCVVQGQQGKGESRVSLWHMDAGDASVTEPGAVGEKDAGPAPGVGVPGD